MRWKDLWMKLVKITEKNYDSRQETNYLLRSKANSEALAHSINQLDDFSKHHLLTSEEFERLITDARS